MNSHPRQFEMDRDERIRQQNTEAQKKHEEILAQAEEFKIHAESERKELISSRKQENKERQESSLQEDETSESPWEGVLKYCDLKIDETESDDKDTNRLGKLYRRLKSEKHK